ncbi:MAG TPA: hypothetical protein VGR28_09730, partial [Candidatus Thermoplasmatota archaeon]|nr:hypothetical protein [Candidatus Thermoplasmatota archaeon]
MGYFLNPWALGGIIVLVFAWAMSAFVYFARPSGLQNRLVALMLALEGAGMGCGVGLMWLTDDYAASFGWQMVGFTTFAASMPVYMLFLGTLDAPLARPLKLRLVRRALAACAVIAPVIVMLSP